MNMTPAIPLPGLRDLILVAVGTGLTTVELAHQIENMIEDEVSREAKKTPSAESSPSVEKKLDLAKEVLTLLKGALGEGQDMEVLEVLLLAFYAGNIASQRQYFLAGGLR